MICDQTGREVRDKIDELKAENKRMREALETLARLGNGDKYGHSNGNRIAREALEGTKP
jgi:hypothetical protein